MKTTELHDVGPLKLRIEDLQNGKEELLASIQSLSGQLLGEIEQDRRRERFIAEERQRVVQEAVEIANSAFDKKTEEDRFDEGWNAAVAHIRSALYELQRKQKA